MLRVGGLRVWVCVCVCVSLPEGWLLFSLPPPAAAGRGGGGESSVATAKWNGKSSASATATCHAFNGGRDHQADHLFPTALAGFGQGAYGPLLWGSPSHCLH